MFGHFTQRDPNGIIRVGENSAENCKKMRWKSGTKHMGVSKIRGTPKWMIYNGNPY